LPLIRILLGFGFAFIFVSLISPLEKSTFKSM
jgi:hypothetical protein